MATLVLFGPSRGGKTTFCNSARRIQKKKGEKTPRTLIPQDEWDLNYMDIDKPNNGFFNADSIMDTSGQPAFLNNKAKLDSRIWLDKYVGIVFNICEFVEEIQNPREGGYINSLLKYTFLPIWERRKADNKRLYLIGTHKDEYLRKHPSVTNMEEEVRSLIRKANNDYIKISGKMRYPYYSPYFEGEYFCCIDATNLLEVRELVHSIFS